MLIGTIYANILLKYNNMARNDESLDVWVKRINEIYVQANGERDFKDVLLFSFEEVGRCSQLINRKRDEDIINNIPRLFMWFCILYAKSGVKTDINDVIWNKFPGICPYCKKPSCTCYLRKFRLDYSELMKKAKETVERRPQTLDQWQDLFQTIYRRTDTYKIETNVSHLFEELSELSEVHRLPFVDSEKNLIDMELADVFSWIMGLANFFDQQTPQKRYLLSEALSKTYKNSECPECFNFRKDHQIDSKCSCSAMKQELRLVSDYLEEKDVETDDQKTNNDIHNTNEMRYL